METPKRRGGNTLSGQSINPTTPLPGGRTASSEELTTPISVASAHHTSITKPALALSDPTALSRSVRPARQAGRARPAPALAPPQTHDRPHHPHADPSALRASGAGLRPSACYEAPPDPVGGARAITGLAAAAGSPFPPPGLRRRAPFTGLARRSAGTRIDRRTLLAWALPRRLMPPGARVGQPVGHPRHLASLGPSSPPARPAWTRRHRRCAPPPPVRPPGTGSPGTGGGLATLGPRKVTERAALPASDPRHMMPPDERAAPAQIATTASQRPVTPSATYDAAEGPPGRSKASAGPSGPETAPATAEPLRGSPSAPPPQGAKRRGAAEQSESGRAAGQGPPASPRYR